MRNIVRVGATSLATLEATKPPYNLGRADVASNFARGLEILEAAGKQGAEFIALPETFLTAGIDTASALDAALKLDAPEIEKIASIARKYNMHIVFGALTYRESEYLNSAVMIDGSGEIIGIYDKVFPTKGELDCGVRPGSTDVVFETELGCIGLGICFDLNDARLWQRYRDEQADFVVWISAYDGGFPLRARAWDGQVPIVTSVMSYHGYVIDITGEELASTSRWSRLAVHDLNIAKRLLHTDLQAEKILGLQAKFGTDIRLTAATEEHYFTIEPLSNAIDVDQLLIDEGLVTWNDYIADSLQHRDRQR